MFFPEYFGKRANSTAIHPKFRVILFSTSRRCFSVHSGNASRRLNSAVFLILGIIHKSRRVPAAASLLAMVRGSAPSSFTSVHATAYCSHSIIPSLLASPAATVRGKHHEPWSGVGRPDSLPRYTDNARLIFP